MERKRSSVYVSEKDFVESDSFLPLFEKIADNGAFGESLRKWASKVAGDPQPETCEKKYGKVSGTFRFTEEVPETMVPADYFWNEERGELELPSYAEGKLKMATKITDLSQVAFVKLLSHKREIVIEFEIDEKDRLASYATITINEV